MGEAPSIIPTEAMCANCGQRLAWRIGVGRYVISHDTGDDMCSRAVARLAFDDREIAAEAYRKADEEFARGRAEAAR